MAVSHVVLVAGAALLALGVPGAVHAYDTRPRPPLVLPDTGAALPDTNAIPPEMVNAGRRIYHGEGTCFACHGADLEGGPVAPTLKAHAWRDAKGGELSAIYYVDTHGVEGTVMVAHPGGISDADAVAVAAYIWSVDHRGAKP